jgi:hypothetical protein
VEGADLVIVATRPSSDRLRARLIARHEQAHSTPMVIDESSVSLDRISELLRRSPEPDSGAAVSTGTLGE